ncbi:MAG TPA: hypothetical protein VE422_43755 [Terriglobia bacterium]|nr:hypothetical protein [Terriglobia bacterium]
MKEQFSISQLAEALNQEATGFQIGNLQQLRMQLHRGERPAAKSIFDRRTIQDHYAFHVGGRTELQFNVATFEREGATVVRDGVAFALEPSQTLPTIEPLLPKIERFNDYVRSNPEDFYGFRMWHHTDGRLYPDHAVIPIDDELIVEGNFIMVGRWVPPSQVSIQQFLSDFDRLLPLYIYTESGQARPQLLSPPPFRAGCPEFVTRTTASTPARTVDVALRHKALQGLLYTILSIEAGADNVAIEHPLELGGSVDAAVRRTNGFSFYELKVAPNVQSCMRSASGQLLEYAYWPSAARADELIVVGEHAPDAEERSYLELLRKRFGLPIFYRQINMETGRLGTKT